MSLAVRPVTVPFNCRTPLLNMWSKFLSDTFGSPIKARPVGAVIGAPVCQTIEAEACHPVMMELLRPRSFETLRHHCSTSH